MDENNFLLDSSSLSLTPAEVSQIKEIEKQHEILLRQSEEMTNAEIPRVMDFLKSLAQAGAVIKDPDYRSQLRALIRDAIPKVV